MSAQADLSPKGLKVAELVKSGEGQTAAIERAPGVYESRGVGNSYLLTTPEGDVLVNAGTLSDGRRNKALFAAVSNRPIRYIVLTQSHVNQYGGLELFKTPDNQVIAHRNYPDARRYGKALKQHFGRIASSMWGPITGDAREMQPTAEVDPDLLIDDSFAFSLGGRRFEVLWTPGGETRDAVIVWLPDEKIAIVGNLFGPVLGNYPNLNTIRGDKPRWAMQFIESAGRLRALKPELLLTGHEELRGAAEIEAAVSRVIDGVQWVHDKTIEGMNAGKDVRTLMREVVPPPELALTELYGKVSWNVRSTWHEYTGFFDPAEGTTDLYGVPRAWVAGDLVELAGGADRIAQRAQRYVGEGKPLEALHLLDVALAADPECAAGQAAKRAALELLLAQSGGQNLWERMWIASQIRALDGQP